MLKSKLFILYNSFGSIEKRAFNKWLASPLHVRHPSVIALFQFISGKRKFTEQSLSKHKAFEHLFPGQAYNDNKMRHLMSDAYETLTEFIIYHQSGQDNFRQGLYLNKGFSALKMDKMAEKQLIALKKEQQKRTIKDAEFFIQNYELEKEFFELKAKQQRTEATNLQEITATFTIFFIINTLKYACKSKTHSTLRKAAYEIPLLEAVIQQVQSGKYDHIDTVMQYYYSYQVLINPEDEQNYKMLKSYLLNQSLSTADEDFKEIFIAALNFCIRKLNEGHEGYVTEALLLYKEGLRKKTLIEDGVLSRFSYKNIAALGLRCKEFEWTAHFIDQYAAFVQADYRQSYQHYNRAKLAFEQGNYDKAMQVFVQVEYDDVFLNIDAKIMLMKMYYHQKDSEALFSLIDSVKVYLGRKSKAVLSYHKENYSNILRYLQKIIRLNPYEKIQKKQLQEEIERMKPLTEKKWLLSILADL